MTDESTTRTNRTALALRWVAAACVAVGLVLGLMYVTGTLRMVTAPFRGQVEQSEKVNDGDYRIAAYDKFFEHCSSIQADEDRIRNLERERKHAGPDRVFQIDASLTAIHNSRDEKVRDYNTDAQKQGTEGQFRSSDLPYQIDIDKENTTCGK